MPQGRGDPAEEAGEMLWDGGCAGLTPTSDNLVKKKM
jgi:hypothetical protein